MGDAILCPILKMGVCEKACCDFHSREPGEGIHYCEDCARRQTEAITINTVPKLRDVSAWEQIA